MASFGCSHENERLKFRTGSVVLRNDWVDSFHLWVVDSTQLERARSVIK